MTELCEIATKYGTDKGPSGWGYTAIYSEWLAPIREAKTVLEVGVWRGYSARTWREFFPNAMIYGVDNDPTCQINEDRIKTFHCDAYDHGAMAPVMQEVGKVDFFVDDAVHWTPPQADLLKFMWPHMRDHGIYAIEEAMADNLPAIWDAVAPLLADIKRLHIWHSKGGYHLVLLQKGPK